MSRRLNVACNNFSIGIFDTDFLFRFRFLYRKTDSSGTVSERKSQPTDKNDGVSEHEHRRRINNKIIVRLIGDNISNINLFKEKIIFLIIKRIELKEQKNSKVSIQQN